MPASSRSGQAAFFGFAGYFAGLVAKYGIINEPVVALIARRLGRGRARLRHQLSGAARLRPDAADGDARRLADAARSRQPLFRSHRRRRRAAGRHRRADPRPVPLRSLRPQRLCLLPDRAVRLFPHRAPHRLFAVRPVAARGQGQCAARRRGRHSGQWPAGRDLYDLGGLCRHRRRAADADHRVLLARRVLARSLGRSSARADHRRHRLSLWRPDRRGDLQIPAGLDLDADAAILAVLDRASCWSSSCWSAATASARWTRRRARHDLSSRARG